MLANREGLFHAHPVLIGISESGQNKLATCAITFRLFQELRDGDWAGCEAEKMEITGWFYLEKKDGSVNAPTVDALKAAFGWDGRDPFWLEDTDLSQHPVQVKLAYEEYEGKKRLKVQFLNPFGSAGTPGVKKADDKTRKSVSTRLGAKFRALAGNPPAKEAKPPFRQSGPPAAPQMASGTGATMEQAWEAFTRSCPEDWSREDMEAEWFRILGQLFPNRSVEALTAADWAVVITEAPKRILPF